MALEFPENLIFGIDEIDEQHRALFLMYNEFTETVHDGRGDEGVRQLLARLEDVTLYHFRYEQCLIEKSGYPDAKEHLKQHARSIRNFKRFETLLAGEKLTRERLMTIKRYLIRLLVNHVKNSDLDLCLYLNSVRPLDQLPSQAAATTARRRIGEILMDAGIISSHTLELALDRQKKCGRKLGRVLIEMGAVKAEDVVEACAVQIGLLAPEQQQIAA